MSIVTRRGDNGMTGLVSGERVPKHHPRLIAYGTTDEAQSAIGMIRAAGEIGEEMDALLGRLQRELFAVASDLATVDPEVNVPRVTSEMIKSLEAEITCLEKDLPPLKHFVVPAGTAPAATCFWARTIVRAAERNVSTLLETGQRVAPVLVYLNRLGDLLFLLARALNHAAGIKDQEWSGKAGG